MPIRLKPLADQVIVITGASSGIGLATARAAALRGARLFLIARDEAALAQIADDIASAGGAAGYHAADVGDFAAMEAAAAAAMDRFGRIDTWVNNAGVAIYAKLLDTPLDEHARMIQTNYFGAVHGAMVAVPRLSEHGGALITVASIAADVASPVMGAYAASKHAVQGYIRALRIELLAEAAPIVVTLIKPSGIDTPIAQHASNRMGGEAQIPPPVYDPQLVADAILDAATNPRREVTVGGAGRLQTLFAEHFPALFDRIAPLAATQFVDPKRVQPEPNNLFEPQRTGRVHSGEGMGRQTSIYTAARRHGGAVTASAAVGLGLGLIALVVRRRR